MADKISRLLCSCSSKFTATLNSTRGLSSCSSRRFNLSSYSSPVETGSLSLAKFSGYPLLLLKINEGGDVGRNSYTSDPFSMSSQPSIKIPLPLPLGQPVFDVLNVHQNQNPITNPMKRLPIGIPINYRINPITYEDKNESRKKPMEDPLTILNQIIIEDSPEIAKARIEKKAARLIVIRRIKMNKHKLKKLRKRMRHIWAKVKLRRAIRRERQYLDEKLAQIREAERFDAKEYVTSLIAKAKEKPIPRRWRGKRMPAWWIKEQIALGKITL